MTAESSIIEALLPDPSYFTIKYKGEHIPVDGFFKINITFSDRIYYENGSRNTCSCPLIVYYVKLNESSEKTLSQAHSGNANIECFSKCLSRNSCSVVLGPSCYKFNGFINFVPSVLCSPQFPGRKSARHPMQHDIFIEIDFDKVESNLYTGRAKDFYKEYVSRYEIMEIE